MKTVEEDSDIWLKYCKLAPWRKARCDLLFAGWHNKGIYSIDDPHVDKCIFKVRK